MKLKQITSLALALMLVFALAACGGGASSSAAAPASTAASTAAPASEAASTPAAPSGDPVKIGLIAMLTGANPLNGERMQQAVQLAVDEVNAAGGLLGGRPVELLVEDDQTLQDMAVTCAQKLMSEGVAGVVGPHRSTNAMAVEADAKAGQVSFLTGGTTPAITDLDNPYLFRARASDRIFAEVAATYAVEKLGAKTIGMFYNNDEFGTGAMKVVEQFCADNGLDFVPEGHNTNDKDFTGQIMKMKSSGAEAVIIWTHDPELAIHARQIAELNLGIPVVSSPGVTMPQVIEMCDPAHIEGWYGVTDYVNTNTTPGVQEFSEKFEATYGVPAELYSASYYGAAVALLDAIERAGTDDPVAVRDALAATKDLAVPVGTATCDENNDLIHGVVVAQLKDGVPEYIETITV